MDVGCGLMPIITGVLIHLAYTFAIRLAVTMMAARKAHKKKDL